MDRRTASSLKERVQWNWDPDDGAEEPGIADAVVATVTTLIAFKRALTKHGIPPDVYPVIAANILLHGLKALPPEQAIAFSEQTVEWVRANTSGTAACPTSP